MSSTQEASRALRSKPAEVGRALAAIPEDQWFERKSSRIEPREMANHLIGLANADGGLVVVGLYDGAVEGVDQSSKRRNDLMQAHIDYCQPAVPGGVPVPL